jgi:4-aminobutyrate aminotransferase-like enzyme
MNYKPNFRINPPLILSRDEAEEGLEILDEVFEFVAGNIPFRG